jgi:RNA polymerase sigma-70 factor (ECF subfamily)
VSLFQKLKRIPTEMAPAAEFAFAFSALMKDDPKAIVRGLRRRDPELLDQLIEQYQYRLFRYLFYLTRDRGRAEDFFQETWLRLLERGHQYDGRSKFEAWLFAIARNLVLDWQKRKRPRSLDEMLDSRQGAGAEPSDSSSKSPFQIALDGEQRQVVQTSLEKLPVVYREVLLLRFQEEMQLEEIGTVLNTPVSTVKSRLYRGLAALRETLPGESA